MNKPYGDKIATAGQDRLPIVTRDLRHRSIVIFSLFVVSWFPGTLCAEDNKVWVADEYVSLTFQTSSPYSGVPYKLEDIIHVGNSYLPLVVHGESVVPIQKVVIRYKIIEDVFARNLDDLDGANSFTLKKVTPGAKVFTFMLDPVLGNMVTGLNVYDVSVTSTSGMEFVLRFSIAYEDYEHGHGKPVIYLYPPQAARVDVRVTTKNGISVSEPAIDDGWHVIAEPNGRLTNLNDGKHYPYLYWESPDSSKDVMPSTGFVVPKDRVAGLVKEKLSEIGLRPQEISDFCEFWLPKMTKSDYYLIHFFDTAWMNRIAPITISVKPDVLLRVYMRYWPLEQSIEIAPQKLVHKGETGFVVHEWGGRLTRSER